MFPTFLNNHIEEILAALQLLIILTFYAVTRMKVRKKFAANLEDM